MEPENDVSESPFSSALSTAEKVEGASVAAASHDHTFPSLLPPQPQGDGPNCADVPHIEPLALPLHAEPDRESTIESKDVILPCDTDTQPPAKRGQHRIQDDVKDDDDPEDDRKGPSKGTRSPRKAARKKRGPHGQRKRAMQTSSDEEAADDESFLDYWKSRVARKKRPQVSLSQQQQEEGEEDEDDEVAPKGSKGPFREMRTEGRPPPANDVVATVSTPIPTAAIITNPRRCEEDNDKNGSDNDKNENDNDDKEIVEGSDDSVESPIQTSPLPKKRPLACPHCHKIFTVHSALQYHVTHFVCRRELRPTGSLLVSQRSGGGRRPTLASVRAGAAANPREANQTDDRDSDTVEGDDQRESDHDDDKRLSELKFKTKPQPKQQPLLCPHCSKLFAVQSGLQYHLHNFVCRPALRLEGSPVKKRGRPKKSDTSFRKAARKRLIVDNEDDSDSEITKEDDDDKTNDNSDSVEVKAKKTVNPKKQPLACPHCSKIFAVHSGLQYHVNNFVCRPEDRLEGSPVKKRGCPKKCSKPAPASFRKTSSQQRESDNEDNITESDSAEDDDHGEDDDSVELTAKKKTLQPKTQPLPCPHCSKFFSVGWRLQHHVDKFVCRPALRLEESPIQKRGRPKKSDTAVPTSLRKTASKPRKRETLSPPREAFNEDDTESDSVKDDDYDKSNDTDDDSAVKVKPTKSRKLKKEPAVCPYCSKIFSVRSRLKYHLNKFVCRPALRLEGSPVQATDRLRKSGVAVPGSYREVASKPREAVKGDDADSDSVEDDGDDKSNDDYDDLVERKPKKKHKLKNDPLACPHCNKVFTIHWGLQYHVNNFVCRPATRPGGPGNKGRPKSSEKVGIKEYKRLRGAAKDRTCPNCRRVFTSVWGCEYHREKRVCENPQKTSSKPFDTLLQGQRFATKYGVVEVINDDRAIPTAGLAEDFKQRLKVFYSSLTKRQVQMKKQLSNVAVATRACRTLLRRMFEAGDVTQQSLVEAYRGINTIRNSDKRAARTPQPARPIMEDPTAPRESYPDRMVECIIVPDKRSRVLGDDDANLMEGLPSAQSLGGKAIRIYIQRRLLTNMYIEENTRYHCSHCWQSFLSKPGLKYHTDSEACLKKAEKDAAAAKVNLQSIEQRADELVALVMSQQEVLALSSCRVLDGPCKGFRNSSERFNGPRVERRPAVASSDHVESDHVEAIPVIPAKSTEMEVCAKTTTTEEEVDTCDILVPPDEVIAKLEVELYRVHGTMIGPMYPEVWKSLGYQKPKKKPRKRKKRNANLPRRKRRKRGGDAEPEAVETVQPDLGPPLDFMERTAPEPAIVDTRALVKEVDAGRYPTINRYVGEHDGTCIICKDSVSPIPLVVGQQNLISCDFCQHVVHFSCISTVFTLKDPEPEDDFMCHHCIRRIAMRRSRAERRRLEKLNPDVPVTLKKDNDLGKIQDMIDLTKGTVLDREFECVAAQARRVEDLSELLRDAQRRLAISMEVAAMNQTRRALMEAMYEDDANNVG